MVTADGRSLNPVRGINLDGFVVDLRKLAYPFWWTIGQARSKCEHIGRAPLSPEKWSELHVIYLVKGVHSTTAIEGNTLTEDEVLRIYRSELTLPPSRQYQQQEVLNIIEALNRAYREGTSRVPLTLEEINGYNELVLKRLEVEDHVLPGSFRRGPVSVGRYACPAAADVAHYMQKFVEWYNAFPEVLDGLDGMSTAIIKAVATHLYFVLIHPYGDGNGRTARLLEWRTLDAAGMATPATHLLSNHYNLTRSRYYQMLDRASLSGDATSFYEYAIQGLLDQLEEQLKHFHQQYEHLVYSELVRSKTPGTAREVVLRRQELAMAICRASKPVKRSELRSLTPQLASKYAQSTEKTLSRDLSALQRAELIRPSFGSWSAVTSAMFWRHRRDQQRPPARRKGSQRTP
jgi:Fic family protein